MTTQHYQQVGQRVLAQARVELADGRLPQASQQGWSAASQVLSAIAQKRGWEHTRRRHHLITVSQLRAETGDPDIRRLFRAASDLQENFHEDTMLPFEVAEALDDVAALMEKLLPLLDHP